jgi:hypothetical protein
MASRIFNLPTNMSSNTLDTGISAEAYQFIADVVYEPSRIRLGEDKQALVTGTQTPPTGGRAQNRWPQTVVVPNGRGM